MIDKFFTRRKIMTKILFVCHGNICRSPMAHFIMQNLVEIEGCARDFFIESKATSTEEIGNGIYPQARAMLNKKNVPLLPHRASQITKDDYEKYDVIVGMDFANIRNMNRIFGGDPDNKIFLIRQFSGSNEEVDDPWYTNDFETCYNQVEKGCRDLLKKLKA